MSTRLHSSHSATPLPAAAAAHNPAFHPQAAEPPAALARRRRARARARALALSLALLAPAGGCAMLHAHAAGSAQAAASKPVKAVLTLKPFLVNLADPGGTSFLRTTLALGLTAPVPPSEGTTPPEAKARDAIISVLTASTSTQLLAPQGKAALKARLLQAVHHAAPKLPVKAIYFTDFLIQR